MTSGPILLATLRGLVEAPLEIVAVVLLDVGPDGNSPIRPPGRISQIDSSDGIYRAIFDRAGSRVAVRVDSIAHTASIQGMWWYRADFTLTSKNGNCLVTQRISMSPSAYVGAYDSSPENRLPRAVNHSPRF